MQVHLASGNEDFEFRVYENTLLSTRFTGRLVLGCHGGLEADSLASVCLANKIWKEGLSKRLVWTMTDGLLMPPPEVSSQRSSGPIHDLSIYLASLSLPVISQILAPRQH